MQQLNIRDVVGGLGICGIGAFVIWEASSYPMGELRQMGPGYFPVWLGIVMIGLGLLIMFESTLRGDEGEDEDETVAFQPSLRAVVAITASLIGFALLLPSYGLVPATFAMVVISSFAERNLHLLSTLLVAALLAAFSVLAFIHGFRLPVEAFV